MPQDIYPVSLTANPEGLMALGGVALSSLANTYDTPLYVMDGATLVKNCQTYTHSLATHYPDSLVVFAGKANLNLGLLNVLAKEGLGVDVVSGGELYTALKSRMTPSNIVFHGNNKSKSELEMAISNGIRIVVDHHHELHQIATIAESLGKQASIMLRLKPEIEAHTHEYIKTGHIDSKFGIDKRELISLATWIAANPALKLLGIHSHIGSQIFDIQPYEDLADIMVGHLATLKTECGLLVEELNLGGGAGIYYTTADDPSPIPTYLDRMTTRLKMRLTEAGLPFPRLIVEPGRSIVGNAGITLYTVGAIKDIPGIKTYLFVDGGMADNPRPLLYQSQYTFKVANNAHALPTRAYTIAGRYCESGDILAKDVMLPEVQVGDLIVVFGTGAYNYTMASHYNRCSIPAMAIVENGQHRLLIKRETYEDLIRYDVA